MKHYKIAVEKLVVGETEPTGRLTLMIRRAEPLEDADEELAACRAEVAAALKKKMPNQMFGKIDVYPLSKEQYETQQLLLAGMQNRKRLQ